MGRFYFLFYVHSFHCRLTVSYARHLLKVGLCYLAHAFFLPKPKTFLCICVFMVLVQKVPLMYNGLKGLQWMQSIFFRQEKKMLHIFWADECIYPASVIVCNDNAILMSQGDLKIRDQHGEPLATSFHSKFLGTVDYIWYTNALP